MNRLTAQEVKDLVYNYDAHMADRYPKNSLTFSAYLDGLLKPKKKVVDLSVLIESGIDCEFSSRGEPYFVAKLKSIHPTRYYSSDSKIAQDYWKCRPRMNHIHIIPVRGAIDYANKIIELEEAGFRITYTFHTWGGQSYMWIKFMELGAGWCYPWEQEVNDATLFND